MKRFVAGILSILSITLVMTGCLRNDGLFTQIEYTKMEYAEQAAEVQNINIDAKNHMVQVETSPDDQIYINYTNSNVETANLVLLDGVLTMTIVNEKGFTGSFFQNPAIEFRKIVLQLPETTLNRVSILTSNGDIFVSAMPSVEEISLESTNGNVSFTAPHASKSISLTSDNGEVSVFPLSSVEESSLTTENVNDSFTTLHTSKSISLTSGNGDVSISPLPSVEELSLTTGNGDVSFTALNASKSIMLSSNNGDISGSVVGNQNEYAITCNVNNGDSNLPVAQGNGIKNLQVSNGNGDVDVSFMGN